MIQLESPVVETRRVGPGVALLHLHAPEIASRARPGQFVLARCADGHDPLLRRPFPLFSIAPPQLALLVRADDPGRRWLARLAAGQVVDLFGPFGQDFTLASTTRRLLLIGEGLSVAAVAGLAFAAIKTGIEVTLLAGAPSASAALPADLLPTDVEYRLATADGSRGQKGSVMALLPDVIRWADQICAAGSLALYHSLAEAIGRRRFAVDDDFAQVWLLGTVACGTGSCLSCTVETRRGPALSCREGPVFRLRDLESW